MEEKEDEIELENRYNRYYQASKNNQIYLEDFLPDDQQSKFLMLKVIEQAARDYILLYKFNDKKSIENWQSAKEFLFTENYYIDWGELLYTIDEMLDLLDVDIDWFKEKTQKRFEETNGKK